MLHSFAARLAKMQNSKGCLLTLHRVAPSLDWEALPNRDFYTDFTFLDNLLAHLTENGWAVAKLDQVLDGMKNNHDGSRLVNFSIDDCYRDTYEKIVPLFRKHKVPVTLFVSTGIPDGEMVLARAGLETLLAERQAVDWNGTNVSLPTSAIRRALFRKIVDAWQTRDFDTAYKEFCLKNNADIDELHELHAMSWSMLETCAHDPFVEIGSHTVRHSRLSELDGADALEEMAASKDRLCSKLGVEIKHFAFPYGRPEDCGEREFKLAEDAGYLTASTTRRGIVGPRQKPFSLPRNTLNAARSSVAYVMTKISGLTGIAAHAVGAE